MNHFADRASAGRQLATRLSQMDLVRPVILALPRGGVPVAFEIAAALEAPLDLVLVRKVGLPSQPELALAAVVDGSQPELVVNDEVMRASRLSERELSQLARREIAEIERRRARYLGDRPPVPLSGCTAIVVDDGIATGTTVRAALKAVTRRGPARLVLAVPVAPASEIPAMRALVDDLVCLVAAELFFGVGQFYRDFHQLADREVTDLLATAPPARET